MLFFLNSRQSGLFSFLWSFIWGRNPCSKALMGVWNTSEKATLSVRFPTKQSSKGDTEGERRSETRITGFPGGWGRVSPANKSNLKYQHSSLLLMGSTVYYYFLITTFYLLYLEEREVKRAQARYLSLVITSLLGLHAPAVTQLCIRFLIQVHLFLLQNIKHDTTWIYCPVV